MEVDGETQEPTNSLAGGESTGEEITTLNEPKSSIIPEDIQNAETKEKDDRVSEDKVKKVYCLCKTSSDTDSFMIGCDNCSDWFHVDCVDITRTIANTIETYYCPPCIEKDASLVIIYKKKYQKPVNDKKQEDDSELRCGACIGCFRSEDCGKCEYCTRGEPCARRKCVQADFLKKEKEKKGGPSSRTAATNIIRPKRDRKQSADEEEANEKPSTLPPSNGSTIEKKKRGRKKGWRKGDGGSQEDDGDDEFVPEVKMKVDPIELRNRMLAEAHESFSRRKTAMAKKRDASPVQCFGPDCVLSARPDSKYCSDECGLRLAEERVSKVLPERIRDYWGTLPVVYKRAVEQGQKLDMQIEECAAANDKLMERMGRIQKWVQAMKSIEPVGSDNEEEGENEKSDATTIACPVCTMEQSARALPKHVERCFVRSEKQITFGTSYQMPQNPGGLFCETHNKATDTYCKRLRVMCAEHYKGELESEMKICGFPIAWADAAADSRTFTQAFALFDDIDSMTRAFCQLPRKECMSHHRWIQTTLGVLECERMNVLTRLDELYDRKRAIMATLQTRGDLISLLSNSTKTVQISQPPHQTSTNGC